MLLLYIYIYIFIQTYILFALTRSLFFKLAKTVDPTGCSLFFDVHGHMVCEYTEVFELLKSVKKTSSPSPTFKQDHVYTGMSPYCIVLQLLYMSQKSCAAI